METMKTVRSIQHLVAYLKQHLTGGGNVLIESPKSLRDSTTGLLREHDAVLTITTGDQTILTAIECRDRKRPVGIIQLKAFAKKCAATAIDKPVMVSPCGFTKPAIEAAKKLGIHCLTFEQVGSFPWVQCEMKLRQIRVNYKQIDFAIIPEKDFEKKPSSFTLVNDSGETIKPENIREYLLCTLMQRQRDSSDLQPGDNVERIRLLPGNLSIIDADTGKKERVRQINLVAYSTNEEIELSFVLKEYKDTGPEASRSSPADLLKKPVMKDVGTFIDRSRNDN
jgi:hypothetical protein